MNRELSPPRSPTEQNDRRETARWFFQRAYELQLANHLEQAVLCYKKSLDLHRTAEAHTFLGWAYGAQARYEDAIAECRAAIALDPDLGNPYNDIGAYLIELGRDEEAVSWLERAVAAKRYASRCFPYFNLGRVHERLGRWRQATEAYTSALRLSPNYRAALQALNRLRAASN